MNNLEKLEIAICKLDACKVRFLVVLVERLDYELL